MTDEQGRARLSELAGVEFSDEDATDLTQMTARFINRNHLSKEEMDWWSRVPRQFLDDLKPQRTRDRNARRAWVEFVEGTWRDRRGRGSGSHYNDWKEVHTGPLIRLLQELLCAAGEPEPPSARTLHRDLVFLYTGRENR